MMDAVVGYVRVALHDRQCGWLCWSGTSLRTLWLVMLMLPFMMDNAVDYVGVALHDG